MQNVILRINHPESAQDPKKDMGITTIIITYLTIELITTPPISRKTCHIDI